MSRDRDRMYWGCRRGLLELDLLLRRFLDKHFDALNAQQREAFKELLAYDDNDLLDMVMERAEPVNTQINEVLGMIRSS